VLFIRRNNTRIQEPILFCSDRRYRCLDGHFPRFDTGFGIQGLPVQNAFLSFHGPGFLSLNRLPSSLYIDQELPPEDAEKKDMANLKAITEKMFEAVLASSRRTG
jgi:hypothetical protein